MGAPETDNASPASNGVGSDGDDELEAYLASPRSRFFKRPAHLRHLVSVKSKRFVRRHVTGDPSGEMRVRDYVKMPRTIKTIDKVSFTLGVVGLLVTQFVATQHPDLFWLYYLVTAPVIFLCRVIQYRMIKYQYFLIDFCYYANVACFAHMAIPSSRRLFLAVFAYSNGPILWAIPLWRNSLVFHSHDKVQSVFIHTMPALLTWCTRWYGQRNILWDVGEKMRVPLDTYARPMGLVEMATEVYLWPVIGYIAWQVGYLVKTEMWDVKRLDEDPELLTSLRWLAKDYKTPLTRWALRTSRRIGLFGRDELFDVASLKTKFVFVSLQLVYTVVTFLPIPLCYVSKRFHTALMLLVFLSCIWNGACYYIDIFSQRYARRFEGGAAIGSLRDEDRAESEVAEANGRANSKGKPHSS